MGKKRSADKPKRRFKPSDFEPSNYKSFAIPLEDHTPPEPPSPGAIVQRYDGFKWLSGYMFHSVAEGEVWNLRTHDGYSLRWPRDRIRLVGPEYRLGLYSG